MQYNILDYGAKPNTMCTEAIQAAMDACAAAGGGRVIIPSGTFISGSLQLHSRTELFLSQGAVLKASDRFADYNADDAYPENMHSEQEMWTGGHLLYAVNAEQITLSGTGIIDGSGTAFCSEADIIPDAQLPWLVSRDFGWMEGFARAIRPGQCISFVRCNHLHIENITVLDAPSWTLFFHGCEDVHIHGITVQNPHWRANTDGLDIDSCRFVTVSDCHIDVGDDPIAIRNSTKRLNAPNRYCEWITVTNCVLGGCASAFRIGVGQHEIRHVRISNCTVHRAGTLFNLNTEYSPETKTPLSDIHFAHISAEQVGYPLNILSPTGVPVHNVSFEDIQVSAKAGFRIWSAEPNRFADISLRNFDIFVDDFAPLAPEKREKLGAAAFRFAGVNGLYLSQVRVHTTPNFEAQWPIAVEMVDCTDVEFDRCRFPENAE